MPCNLICNLKLCRNQKLCINVHQKYRKDVFFAAIFCFAYIKVKDTKYKMLSDKFESSTLKLCNDKREKNLT